MKKRKLFPVVVVSLIIFISGIAAGVAGGQAINETISVVLARDISFELDGQPHEFKDPDGQVQHPIIHEGNSYLPVRSIAEATGVEVDWDDSTRTIILNKNAQDYGYLLQPSWADNRPDPTVARQRIDNYIDSDFEHIYLLEYLDLDDNQSYANYLISSEICDKEIGFGFGYSTRDSTGISVWNNTDIPLSVYRMREDATIERVALKTPVTRNGTRPLISGTIGRAELKDMDGNVIWSNR